MANRNVYEFLNSSDIKTIYVDGGIVMSYHSNYLAGRTYKQGSVVRILNGTNIDTYVCTYENSNHPSTLNGWDKFGSSSTAVFRQVVDNTGLIMIDSGGNYIKTI